MTAIRESRGGSLEEIALSTKINVFYLRAIEAGELDKLPGEFYARSYVRQYARAVGLDENELLEKLHLRLPAKSDQTRSPSDAPAGAWRPAEE